MKEMVVVLVAYLSFLSLHYHWSSDAFLLRHHCARKRKTNRSDHTLSSSSCFGGILEDEAQFAVSIVTEAVKLCRDVQASLATAKDQAGSLGATLQSSNGETSSQKADDTPVTAADFAIQGYFAAKLKERFPQDSFLGEEDASILRKDDILLDKAIGFARKLHGSAAHTLSEDSFLSSVDRGVEIRADAGRTWILDPIDGTKGLMTGQGMTWIIDVS